MKTALITISVIAMIASISIGHLVEHRKKIWAHTRKMRTVLLAAFAIVGGACLWIYLHVS